MLYRKLQNLMIKLIIKFSVLCLYLFNLFLRVFLIFLKVSAPGVKGVFMDILFSIILSFGKNLNVL